MGLARLELHALLFLAKNRSLGRVLTLGRQSLKVDLHYLRKSLKLYSISFNESDLVDAIDSPFIDNLLVNVLLAKSVESMDFSDYEGASLQQDLGELDTSQDRMKKWDTILDFGTLEHVFNIGVAFRNCQRYLTDSGCILHANPANGHSGHGLYQLSPDAYFSAYSHSNFRDRPHCRVFYGNHWTPSRWFEVLPSSSKRVELTNYSSDHSYAICINHNSPQSVGVSQYQQSYVYEWSGIRPSISSHVLRNNKYIIKLYLLIFAFIHRYIPFFLPSVRFHPLIKPFNPVRDF